MTAWQFVFDENMGLGLMGFGSHNWKLFCVRWNCFGRGCTKLNIQRALRRATVSRWTGPTRPAVGRQRETTQDCWRQGGGSVARYPSLVVDRRCIRPSQGTLDMKSSNTAPSSVDCNYEEWKMRRKGRRGKMRATGWYSCGSTDFGPYHCSSPMVKSYKLNLLNVNINLLDRSLFVPARRPHQADKAWP